MPDLDLFLSTLEARPFIAAVRRMKTSRARGRIDVRGKAPFGGKLESIIGYPDKMAVSIDAGAIKIQQICNGGEARIIQNNTVINANPAVSRALRNSLFHNPNNLYRYITAPENRDRLELRRDGDENVVVIRGDEITSEVVFDGDFLIRRVDFTSADANGDTSKNRIEFDHFREWAGLSYPGAVAVFKDGEPLSKIEHDSYEPDAELSGDPFAVEAG